MQRILLVEDTSDFQKIVSRILDPHQVICADCVATALELLEQQTFHLILLDIELPDRDGYSLLAEIQSHPTHASTPIICLTGKTAVTDKVTAFSLGADDYIVKPFDPIEFKARIESKLKKSRHRVVREQWIRHGDLRVDPVNHRASIVREGRSSDIELTQTEFKILVCLANRSGQVYSRQQLLQAVWGTTTNVVERVVDVHVHGLRKKLGPCASYIKAVPGFGYKLHVGGIDVKKAAS